MAVVFLCFYLLTSQFPQQKQMAVLNYLPTTQAPLTCNYMNVKTRLLEGKYKIYF